MRALLLLSAALTLVACKKPEPIERADYWIENRTGTGLHVQHTPTLNLVGTLLADSLPPLSRTRILRVVMGSGGHSMPSNFFRSFRIVREDSVIYSGVRNGDWSREGLIDEHHQLVLDVE